MQISILRCIQQRLAVANLLQGDAALVSELAQDAARHGPLALLHLPIAKYKLSSELEGKIDFFKFLTKLVHLPSLKA